MKYHTFTKVKILMGVSLLLLLNGLMAQEEVRRSLRGSSPIVVMPTDPSGAGGADPLGMDPTRAEVGRPDPYGGAGEPVEPEVDDPFANEHGGAGEPVEPEVDDPFMNKRGRVETTNL